MATDLDALRGHTVLIMTNDGRTIKGTLTGVDFMTNLVLSEAVERLFSADAGCEMADLPGLYLVRGDNIAVVGELDEMKDAGIAWNTVMADPIPPVKH